MQEQVNESPEEPKSNKICPHDSCLISALKSCRNGLYLAAKYRFFHGYAFTILFKRASIKEMSSHVLNLTIEHSLLIGAYSLIYKLIVCLLNKLRRKRSKFNSFLGGCVAGFIVFGTQSHVRSHIIFYVFSRVIVGVIENLTRKGLLPRIKYYPYLAALLWGLSMYLFEDDKSLLNPSLRKALEYLIIDSDHKFKKFNRHVPNEVTEYLERLLIT